MTDKDILNLNQAALYFGCSPQLILRLKRFGWLKAVEDGKGFKTKKTEWTYERYKLDNLAWDYMLSMSMYDIVMVRMNYRISSREIASKRGIPVKVAQLIRDSETAGFIVELVKVHGDQRAMLRRHEDLPGGLSITSLSQWIRRLVDPSAWKRRDKQIPIAKRWWETSGLPVEGCEVQRRMIHGLGSATNPTCIESDADAINVNHLLEPGERFPESATLRHLRGPEV